MAWYDTGTVSVTNGSTAVVGSGTDFISAKVQVGEAFYGPDGKIYEIAAIVSSTSLTLADNYLGTTQSGQTYKIVPTQSLVADLATNVSTLITDFANVRDLAGEGKFDDGTVAAPGITFNLDQDNGLYRIGANNWAMAVGGSKIVDLTSTGFSVTGNVGIGTASPSSATWSKFLQVEDTYPGVVYHSTAGGSNYKFSTGVDDDKWLIRDETAAATRLIVDSSGRLIVGHTSLPWPQATSSASITAGMIQQNGTISATTDQESPLYLNRTTDDGALARFYKDGAPVGSIASTDGTDLQIGSGNCYLRFDDADNKILPTNAAGAKRDNVLDLGHTDARFGDLYLSNGVVFGATGGAVTSKTLDDYEEGTWTIVLKDGTGNTYSGTYQSNNGRYTKIGRVVHCTFELYVGAVDLTASGLTSNEGVRISGLPFNSNSSQFTFGGVSNGNGINFTGSQLYLRMARNVDEVILATITASTYSTDGEVTVTQFNNGNRLVYGTIMYEVV